MQKHPDGATRPEDAPRHVRRQPSIATRINRRSISAASALQARFRGRVITPEGSLSASLARSLRSHTTAERALPVAVAAIVAMASLLALLPNSPQGGAIGGTDGRGTDVRIAIGGDAAVDARGLERDEAPQIGGALDTTDISFQPVRLPDDIMTVAGTEQTTAAPGAFLDDGTLLTGYAPETTVEDGSDLIRVYRVKSGDTLVTIARAHSVSMMTLWWANKLKAKDDLRIGQLLKIPTVNGLIVTVTETDTLETLAARYDITEARIIELNELDDPTLVVGQVLILPDAKGAPIPTPKPTPKPTAKPRTSSGTVSRPRTTTSGPVNYTGGAFRWPVVGGSNYISQYYRYGHYGLDIAADFGSRVIAAAGGRVIFAGWKSNGGGWQVWISHGGGLYSTYNHMSAVSVGNGQSVGRGQQVGRIGQSGYATGPHLHFEVWRGMIWDGGQRVNPLKYF